MRLFSLVLLTLLPTLGLIAAPPGDFLWLDADFNHVGVLPSDN